MSYYNQQDQSSSDATRLKDIDERLREKIVENISEANTYLANADYIKAFRSLNIITNLILPFEFSRKESIEQLGNDIEKSLSAFSIGGGRTESQKIYDSRRREEGINMIKEYHRFLFQCLKELNLYLRTSPVVNDTDAVWADRMFGMKKSLTIKKKNVLKQYDKEKIIRYLTPDQISDVYARIVIHDTRGKGSLEESN